MQKQCEIFFNMPEVWEYYRMGHWALCQHKYPTMHCSIDDSNIQGDGGTCSFLLKQVFSMADTHLSALEKKAQTITAHGNVQPADLTSRTGSRMGSMLIQLGFKAAPRQCSVAGEVKWLRTDSDWWNLVPTSPLSPPQHPGSNCSTMIVNLSN